MDDEIVPISWPQDPSTRYGWFKGPEAISINDARHISGGYQHDHRFALLPAIWVWKIGGAFRTIQFLYSGPLNNHGHLPSQNNYFVTPGTMRVFVDPIELKLVRHIGALTGIFRGGANRRDRSTGIRPAIAGAGVEER